MLKLAPNDKIILNKRMFFLNRIIQSRMSTLSVHKICLLFSVFFAGIYAQSPLFSSNQHCYFVRGMARAGVGNLASDWYANLPDPIPIFSFIVYLVVEYAHPFLFYGMHAFLLGWYMWALSQLVIYCIDNKDVKLATSITLFIIIIVHFISRLGDYIPIVKNIPGLLPGFRSLIQGVAGFVIPGDYFQASAFGVFLIVSIAFFLKKKIYAAVLFALLTAILHPSYFLQSGIVICSYIIILCKEKKIRSIIILCLISLVFVVPTIMYLSHNFYEPVDRVYEKAVDIIVNIRAQHHSKIQVWLYQDNAIAKIVIMCCALFLVRKKQKLFIVLSLFFFISFFLTLTQTITSSRFLTVLFPWRSTAFLMPISTTIILSYLVSSIFSFLRCVSVKTSQKRRMIDDRSLIALLLVLSFCLAAVGVIGTNIAIHEREKTYPFIARFIRKNISSNDCYLIPPNIHWFRLYTRGAIFVDKKSQPWDAAGIVEWYDRLILANTFYTANDIAEAQKYLMQILTKEKITHIVTEADSFDLKLLGFTLLARDIHYCLYVID